MITVTWYDKIIIYKLGIPALPPHANTHITTFSLFFIINQMFGRIAHFTADAVLISAVLAGIRRNSGLE